MAHDNACARPRKASQPAFTRNTASGSAEAVPVADAPDSDTVELKAAQTVRDTLKLARRAIIRDDNVTLAKEAIARIDACLESDSFRLAHEQSQGTLERKKS